MASSIEQRIVQMKFDNSQFESGVSTTLGTLDKLKAATEMKGVSAGMAALGSAAETIQYKFSVMGTVIDQTIRNITNQVEAVAAKMVSSITTQPIKDGFAEYETQIGAVQTILANTSSKGTTLDEVNNALDTLNAYADKTIYNFTQMTRNIGTFTAAGVDLNTSVKSIQGIANLAAVSGSTSQQASTAMYQLSQAIAAGTVKLMDWNSVVNAGMGGAVFQEALKRTSEHLGTGAEAAITASGSFRESLSKGWLTVDVLTKTLEQFSLAVDTEEEYNAAVKKLVEEGYTAEQAKEIADMAKTAGDAATKVKTFSQLIDTLKEALGSGWTQTWEIIIGDFEEAKEVWTAVSDVLSTFINAMSNSRNEMMEEWSDLGGRDAILRSLTNVFYNLLSVVVPIGEAFREIFPATTGKQLADLSLAVERFTEKFYLSKDSAEGLKNTFKGLFAAVDIVWQAFKAIVSAIFPVTSGIGSLVLSILDVTGGIGNWVVALDESIKANDTFGKAIEKVKNFFQPLADLIMGTGKTIKDIFTPALEELGNVKVDIPISEGLLGRLSERFKSLSPVIQGFAKVFQSLGKIFQKVAPVISTVVGAIGKFVANGIEALANAVADADFSKIFDIINGGALTLATLNLSNFFKSLSDMISGKNKKEFNLGDFFKGLLDGTSLQGAIDTLGEIKGAVLDTFGAFQDQLKSKSLKDIATAIAIFTGSLVVLSMIDSKKLAVSLAAVGALMFELNTMLTALSGLDIKGKGLSSIAMAMIPLAAAVGILSLAVAKMGSMDLWSLMKGLAGTITVMIVLAGVMESLAADAPKMSKGASAMIMVGVAVKVIASAVEQLGSIDLWSLVKGLAAVRVVLLELSTFMNGTTGKLGISTGVGLIAFAAGLKIICGVINTLGNMDTETLLVGLLGMAGALAEIALAVSLMPATTPLIGAGLILVGGALVIIASALKIMGSMSWDEVGKSLVALGVALAELAVGMTAMILALPGAAAMLIAAPAIIALALALKVMGSMSGGEIAKSLVTLGVALAELAVGLTAMIIALPGAAALVVAAAGFALLTPQLLLLSGLSLGQLAIALLALGGALAMFGAAAVILSPSILPMLALAGALVAIGAATALAGVGLSAIGVGLTMIASSGAAAATALGTLLTQIVGLIPTIVSGLTELISNILNMIITLAPQICATVVSVGISVLAAIKELVPRLVDTVVYIITQTLKTIATYLPQIMEAATDCIVAFVEGIANGLGRIIQAGIDLMISFINGMADGIRNNTDRMIAATDNLMDAVIEAIGKWLKHFIEQGGELIKSLIEGIKEHGPDIAKKIGEFIQDAIDAIGDFFDGMLDAGVNLVSGFISGISGEDSKKRAKDAGSELSRASLDGIEEEADINSPSKEAKKDGEYVAEGYSDGVESGVDAATDAGRALSDASLVPLKDTSGAAAAGAANAAAYNNALRNNVKTYDPLEEEHNSVTKKAPKFYDPLEEEHNSVTTSKSSGSKTAFQQERAEWLKELREKSLGNYDATNDLTDATDELTASTDANTESTGSNTSSKSSNTEATKKSAEEIAKEQKTIEKFTKYSVASIAATQKVFDSMFGTVEEGGDHLTAAQDAVIALAEQIYASSLETEDNITDIGDTTEEVSESSQEHIQAIMEAFNEQYETYRDNIKSSMDLFERFDNQISDTTKGSEVLANAKSQVEGYTFLAQKYLLLANRGVSRSILADLEEEGTSALPKINSMLKMSDSQLKEYIADLENIDAVSGAVAGQMMAAQAMANTTAVWRKQAATQSNLTTKMRNDYADYINQMNILAYKSVEGTNLLFEETLDETHAGTVKVLDESGTVVKEQTIDIQAAIARLATDAKEAGIECDDMMKALGDTAATEATAALQLVDAYTKAASTVVLYNEYMSDMKNTVKETIESQLDLFDELELKTELTSKEVISNLESQIKGMQQWAAEYQAVANRGLNSEILSELAELGPEGYEKLHAFYTMTDAELQKYNALYAQRLSITETVSAQIGQSYAAAAVGGMSAYTNALKVYMGENPEYQAALNNLSTSAKTVLTTTMATVGQEAAAKLTETLSGSITTSSESVSTATTGVVDDAVDAANQAISEGGDKTKNTAIVAGSKTKNGYASKVNADSGKKQTDDYVAGVINSFEANSDALYSAAYGGGETVDRGFHDGAGNGSPSWKGAQQAMWYLMGVANGLKNMSGDAEDAAYGSGTLIAEALGQAMLASNELTDDMTLYPTIAPVIDLTDAQNGADQLASILGNNYGLNLNPNLGRITTESDRLNSLAAMASNRGSMTYGDTVLNIYGAQGQNVNQLADIVINRLNNEYARRKAAWT